MCVHRMKNEHGGLANDAVSNRKNEFFLKKVKVATAM
jgi:hypothetical protein